MQTKNLDCRIKAAGESDGLEEGQYRALVSVFGNTDSVGDVVMPGAFTKTLDEWDAKGDPIPLIWQHDWYNPFSHLGHVVKAEETDDGLVITGQLDLDNPTAEQVYRLLKGRRVTQHSFAFDVIDAAPAEKDGRDVHELRELKVYEVGPCLVGANQATELLAAKNRELAEKQLASDFEAIQAAHEALGRIIKNAAAPDPDNEDADQTSGPGQGGSGTEDTTGQAPDEAATDEDPELDKSAAKSPKAPAQVLASLTTDRMRGERHAVAD